MFTGMVVVDCKGMYKLGGVALLWRDLYDVQLLSQSLNHVDVVVIQKLDGLVWRFTGVYGYPLETEKQKTWDLLKHLKTQSTLPWLCTSDHNEVLYNLEKKKMGCCKVF